MQEELEVTPYEIVAGPEDEENRGQIVTLALTGAGKWQRQAVTRLTVTLGIIQTHPN
jgi:hypothetical protein